MPTHAHPEQLQSSFSCTSQSPGPPRPLPGNPAQATVAALCTCTSSDAVHVGLRPRGPRCGICLHWRAVLVQPEKGHVAAPPQLARLVELALRDVVLDPGYAPHQRLLLLLVALLALALERRLVVRLLRLVRVLGRGARRLLRRRKRRLRHRQRRGRGRTILRRRLHLHALLVDLVEREVGSDHWSRRLRRSGLDVSLGLCVGLRPRLRLRLRLKLRLSLLLLSGRQWPAQGHLLRLHIGFLLLFLPSALAFA